MNWDRAGSAKRHVSRRAAGAGLLVAVLMTACTAAPPITPAGTPTPAPASAAPPAATATATTAVEPADDTPAAIAAWELDGDGLATIGGGRTLGGALTFTGIHEFSEDAVVLDGRTAYGATSGSGPLNTTASFSAAAWVTIAGEAEFASVLSQVGNVAAAFYLGIGEGVWSFAMKDLDTNDPGHTIRALAQPPVVDPEKWVHLVGVFDATAGEIRLFIDGELAAATAFDEPWQAFGPLAMGAGQAHGAPSDFWPGAVAHAAVYQAALTHEHVTRLHESTRPTTAAPVLAPADPASYGNGMLNGTWDLQMSDEELKSLTSGFSPEEAAAVGLPDADVKIRLGFSDNTWWQGFVFDDELWLVGGVPEGDGGIFSMDGDELTVTNGVDGWLTLEWSLDGDVLMLTSIRCAEQSGVEVECETDFLPATTVWKFSGTDASY